MSNNSDIPQINSFFPPKNLGGANSLRVDGSRINSSRFDSNSTVNNQAFAKVYSQSLHEHTTARKAMESSSGRKTNNQRKAAEQTSRFQVPAQNAKHTAGLKRPDKQSTTVPKGGSDSKSGKTLPQNRLAEKSERQNTQKTKNRSSFDKGATEANQAQSHKRDEVDRDSTEGFQGMDADDQRVAWDGTHKAVLDGACGLSRQSANEAMSKVPGDMGMPSVENRVENTVDDTALTAASNTEPALAGQQALQNETSLPQGMEQSAPAGTDSESVTSVHPLASATQTVSSGEQGQAAGQVDDGKSGNIASYNDILLRSVAEQSAIKGSAKEADEARQSAYASLNESRSLAPGNASANLGGNTGNNAGTNTGSNAGTNAGANAGTSATNSSGINDPGSHMAYRAYDGLDVLSGGTKSHHHSSEAADVGTQPSIRQESALYKDRLFTLAQQEGLNQNNTTAGNLNKLFLEHTTQLTHLGTDQQAGDVNAIAPKDVATAFRPTGNSIYAQSPLLQMSSALDQKTWATEVGHRLTWMLQTDLQQAQLQLNPKHLGPLEIKISLNADQQINVHFTAHSASVKDALDQAIPRLREAFDQSGLNLNDVNIQQHSRQSNRDHHHTSGQSSPRDNQLAENVHEEIPAIQNIHSQPLSSNIVDFFA